MLCQVSLKLGKIDDSSSAPCPPPSAVPVTVRTAVWLIDVNTILDRFVGEFVCVRVIIDVNKILNRFVSITKSRKKKY